MYFKLKPQYALRGWNGASWILIKRPFNEKFYLSHEEFNALILCDGVTDITEDMCSIDLKEYFIIDDENILEECAEPSPIEDDQYYKYHDNRFVQSVFWSMTGKCNYKCKHCFMDAPEGVFGELNTEEALKLIDDMNECGILTLDITGGEPLVRRDFWTLIDRVVSYKININQIYTNGWLVNEKFLLGLKERGLHPEICISFDGVGWHDWMRGVKGAEEAAYRAFELCRKHGFRAGAQMCIFKGNAHLIPETVEKLASLGVMSLKTGDVADTDLWCKNCEDNKMEFSEYLDAMLDYIPKFFEQGRPMNVTLSSVIGLPSFKSNEDILYIMDRTRGCQNPEKCKLCHEARYTCYIGPNGRLLPCMPITSAPDSVQEKFPFVQEIGLKKALTGSFYMDFIDRSIEDLHKVNKKCANCKYKYICGGGCRASAVINGKDDLMGCDEKLCYEYHHGYYEKINEITKAAVKKYAPELEAK